MMRSSQNSKDSELSEQNIIILQAELKRSDLWLKERKKKERIELRDKIINNEPNCFNKLKLKLRNFCMWLYNKQ